MYHMNISLQLS